VPLPTSPRPSPSNGAAHGSPVTPRGYGAEAIGQGRRLLSAGQVLQGGMGAAADRTRSAGPTARHRSRSSATARFFRRTGYPMEGVTVVEHPLVQTRCPTRTARPNRRRLLRRSACCCATR
jgi:hypothetical protein